MATKKLWLNWVKMGREITSNAAVTFEIASGASEYVHLGTPTFHVSMLRERFTDEVPVELKVLCESDLFHTDEIIECNRLDIKKVFQWLPGASAKLPEWMYSVYVQNGGICVTDNEIVVKYDFPWQIDTLGFTIPPEVIAVMKKTNSPVNGFRVLLDQIERGTKWITFRFADGTFLTYKQPPLEDYHILDGWVVKYGLDEDNARIAFLDKRIVSDIVAVLKDVPYAVGIDTAKCALVELQRELFDEKVIYENDCFQTYYGAYDGKSFKKVFKAMSVGSGCRFYAGGEEGSPAWFSFIGKDGYKVDGILGYLNA